MIAKGLRILLLIAVNGFVAIFVALIIGLILLVAMYFAMIPVGIIGGDKMADSISKAIDVEAFFRIVYAVAFFSMMADDLGIRNIKTAVRKWRERKKQGDDKSENGG